MRIRNGERKNPAARVAMAIAIAIGATAILGATAARGATIYRENFQATTGMQPLSNVGWSAVYGNASTPPTAAAPGSTGADGNGIPIGNAMLSGGNGAATPGFNTPSAGVNASPTDATANSQTAKGFVPLLSKDGTYDFLLSTSEFAIDRTATSIATFQWYAASGYAGDAQRLAVRVAGNWYAKDTAFAPTVIGTSVMGLAGPPPALPIVQPFSTAGWVAINATSAAPLTLGTTTLALPDGAITAFGVYAELADAAGATNERTFVDTFEVTSVPEPTMFAVGGPLALVTRRRRRS